MTNGGRSGREEEEERNQWATISLWVTRQWIRKTRIYFPPIGLAACLEWSGGYTGPGH